MDGRCCEKGRRGIQKLVLHMLSLSVFGILGKKQEWWQVALVMEFVCEAGSSGSNSWGD